MRLSLILPRPAIIDGTVPGRLVALPADFCERNDPRLDVPQNFQSSKSLF